MTQNTELHIVTANILRQHIKEICPSRLQPVATLAAKYGVSLHTMLQAVHLLRAEGILQFRQGQGIRVVPPDTGINNPPNIESSSPASSLAHHIEQKILEGSFKVGTALPKLAYYAIGRSISNHTVLAAYKALCAKKLISKKGKKYIVGPHLKKTHYKRDSEQPVILVLQATEQSLREMYRTGYPNIELLYGFMSAFNNETAEYGIRTMPVLAAKQLWAVSIPCGLRDIAKAINKLGSRYIGALIGCGYNEIENFDAHAEQLVRYKKPVVWFDYENNATPAPGFGKSFFRAHIDDRAAARHALSILHRFGHRKIALPVFHFTGWMERRIALFREIINELSLPVDLVAVPPPKLFWERKNESPFQIMNRLRRTGIPLVRRAIEQLYSDHPEIAGYTELAKPTHNINRIVSPLTEAYRWIMSLSYSLSPYLKQNVTALVPPNSLLAEQFSFWCNAAGLRIPRDMSLLSIDNQYVYLNALPITQIDTGLSRLGYLAFHLMLGDIPTAKSKNNTITAPCRIIDRATVGPARKGALKVNLEGELW